ncbi:Precorrin-6y methyltransferase [gamma proteobacterium HdN1]|nr:Precorrin-6y methyltransferase [gamma proteobacterium HdN1]
MCGVAMTLSNQPKWLSIIGVGAGGLNTLIPAARAAIAEAEIVFGAPRQLELVAGAIRGVAHPWPTPFDAEFHAVRNARDAGKKVCVLASGDPFYFGVGASLSRHISADEFAVFPAPSSLSFAAARLGWALQSVAVVSLLVSTVSVLRGFLQRGARILILAPNGSKPAEVARYLVSQGFGDSVVHVLENLDADCEAIYHAKADEIGDREFASLNVIALEIRSTEQARILPLAGALEDDCFEHDGQITKQEIRALTLTALAPKRGDLLWDVGAGSGSVGISWLLADPSLRAIAIEKHPDRVARIRRNASQLGVPALSVIEGNVNDQLQYLPTPQAIFIGGGGSQAEVMHSCEQRLAVGGRLVANGVTLEMQAILQAQHQRLGGRLTRIAIEHAGNLGNMSCWRPALPVVQWVWVKGHTR